MDKSKIYAIVIIIIVFVVLFVALVAWWNPFSWNILSNLSKQPGASQQIKPPACTHNWTCDWGPCTNSKQSQIAVDSNKCNATITGTIACPTTTRACK